LPRVKFKKGRQKEFLYSVSKSANLNWAEIAKLSNICERSLRDWRAERLNMSYESLLRLARIAKLPIPPDIEILPNLWHIKEAARKGGISRYKLHGNFWTSKGCRRGGLVSQKKFSANPEYFRKLGVMLRKEIKMPGRLADLAEFIGIILGDGNISKKQICVTLNLKEEQDYASYVSDLISSLFGIKAPVFHYENKGACRVIASSVNAVEYLSSVGLPPGKRIDRENNVPSWIRNRRELVPPFLRGLMDTEGSFYSYTHKVYGRFYTNAGLCFTNYSKELYDYVFWILKSMGFNPKKGKNRVYLHRRKEIDRYFREIRTNNTKHLKRYNNFLAFAEN